jgi:hypothetical protein
MSSAAAAADAPEEFAALAEYAIDDFMSEAASDVEVFATTEGHGDVHPCSGAVACRETLRGELGGASLRGVMGSGEY